MKANSTSNTNTIRLIMASRWRRKRLNTTTLCRRALVASKPDEVRSTESVAASDASAATVTMGLVKANPRVQERVDDIRDQVEQNDEGGGDHQPAEHHPGLDV